MIAKKVKNFDSTKQRCETQKNLVLWTRKIKIGTITFGFFRQTKIFMELVDLETNSPEGAGGLRLVSDNKELRQFPIIQKQFVNFIFFRVNPDWRKLDAETEKPF